MRHRHRPTVHQHQPENSPLSYTLIDPSCTPKDTCHLTFKTNNTHRAHTQLFSLFIFEWPHKGCVFVHSIVRVSFFYLLLLRGGELSTTGHSLALSSISLKTTFTMCFLRMTCCLCCTLLSVVKRHERKKSKAGECWVSFRQMAPQ